MYDGDRKSSYSDLFVLCAGSQISAIRAEADAADIEVSFFIKHTIILQSSYQLSSRNIKYLRRAVATSSNIFAVIAKSYTANNAIVNEVMDKVDIQDARHFRVENGVPVGTFSLLARGKLVRV